MFQAQAVAECTQATKFIGNLNFQCDIILEDDINNKSLSTENIVNLKSLL